MFDKLTSPENIRSSKIRLSVSIVMTILSAFLQVFVIQTFMNPCNLISSGFTGLAMLISKIFGLSGITIPIQYLILALNVPVALLCYRKLSKRFVFLSCLQFSLASLFLSLFDFQPIFNDVLLNVLFGGFLYGFAVVLALKTDGSTGGTDFIALYVSERIHRSTWEYVFLFNTTLIIIFGFMFSWTAAGYSILFQFISTQTINHFYHRYAQIMIEITTKYPEEVAKEFSRNFRHGMTVIPAYGAYSQENYFLCRSIISVYEEQQVLEKIRYRDPHAIIYTQKVDHFYGNFYRRPIE